MGSVELPFEGGGSLSVNSVKGSARLMKSLRMRDGTDVLQVRLRLDAWVACLNRFGRLGCIIHLSLLKEIFE